MLQQTSGQTTSLKERVAHPSPRGEGVRVHAGSWDEDFLLVQPQARVTCQRLPHNTRASRG